MSPASDNDDRQPPASDCDDEQRPSREPQPKTRTKCRHQQNVMQSLSDSLRSGVRLRAMPIVRLCRLKTFHISCNLGTFYAKPRGNNSSFSPMRICRRIGQCKNTMLFAQLTSQNATCQCPTICIIVSPHWTKLHKQILRIRRPRLPQTQFPESRGNLAFVCSATD